MREVLSVLGSIVERVVTWFKGGQPLAAEQGSEESVVTRTAAVHKVEEARLVPTDDEICLLVI